MWLQVNGRLEKGARLNVTASRTMKQVILILYMGSLLGLFGLFFAKRSLIGPAEDPGMCGVIKSLENDDRIGAILGAKSGSLPAWHGNVVLNDRGASDVQLPASFYREVSHESQVTSHTLPIRYLHMSRWQNEIKVFSFAPDGVWHLVKGR